MGLDTEPQCRFMDNTLSSKALGHFGWTCETEDPTALYEIVLMTMTSNLILVSIFFWGVGMWNVGAQAHAQRIEGVG